MEDLKKNGDVSKEQDIGLPSSDPEEKKEKEKGEGTGMEANTEGAETFEDFDKEKEKVGEWWLQKGVEEEVEEEPEEEEDYEEEAEGESGEDKDDLIYSLREEDEEDELDVALKNAMDAMGDVSAEELLELSETALREMVREGETEETEEMEGEKSE
ncbi:hypothetical protein ES705_23973 [subsurface metagenome]|nr:hypothetical protein [Methanosarcinales archaeon]